MTAVKTVPEPEPLVSDRDTSGVAAAYAAALAGEVPRVLGLLDRDPASRTRGCFDRLYWSWKFTDFPASRMQEGLYFLAFLYRNALPGADYVSDKRLLEWMSAGFDFWTRLQHRDGSFDEAYPYERSLAATAFTSFYVGEAFALVESDLPHDTARRTRTALAAAGNWLCRNREWHGFLSNHSAAAAAALQTIHGITGEERFSRRAFQFAAGVFGGQSELGWYAEYSGPDPGYQTHGLFYLARMAQTMDDAALRASLRRACRAQACFLHPDGSLGGEYAARNTQTYYPAAFEMLSGIDGSASWIARRMAAHAIAPGAVGLRGIDMGNYFPMLNNHAFAYLAAVAPDHRRATPEAPPHGTVVDIGLARLAKGDVVAYVGLYKGGVVKVFDAGRGRLIGSDCGYFGRLKDGTAISTQAFGATYATDTADDHVTLSGGFYAVNRPVMTPWRFVAFRLFMLTVGRLPHVARWMKQRLAEALIHKKRAVAINFKRTIALGDGEVRITDELSGNALADVVELRWADSFTTIHMGSSRYFVPHEIGGEWPSGEGIDIGQLQRGLTLTRTFRVQS